MKAALLLVAIALSSFAQRPEEVALRQIRPEAIEAHMRFLADDLLEGRGTATRGHELAAKYVATQFQAMGLKPGGDRQTYFQQVPLRTVELAPEKVSATLTIKGREERLVFERDFLIAPPKARTESSMDGSLVFVGFGVSAPDLGHDDYAGIDARGKIVVVIPGAPSKLPAAIRADLSSSAVKFKSAALHGATGVIILWVGEREKGRPFPQAAISVRQAAFTALDREGQPTDDQPSIRASVIFSKELSAKLLANAAKNLDQVLADASAGKPQSFPIDASLSAHGESKHTSATSPNVIAILEGSDPKLRNEFVIYSAHLDHLGIGQAVHGDAIYNGAWDNASGCASLLEVARAFTSLPRAPRRSILFIAVTAEESGLIGSDYFARFPTIQKSAMIANINIDGGTAAFDFRDVVAIAADRSTLEESVEQAALAMKLEVTPDPAPDENMFIRSDQYSFVKQGVPAAYVFPGDKPVDPKVDVKKIDADQMRRYHQPSDDMTQLFDFPASAKFARFEFLLGYLVAQAKNRPSWKSGDFFGIAYGDLKK